MILGIGIDIVLIQRFVLWHTYCHTTLKKIFSDEEIQYCLSNINKSAERFAARFAAREAFFKALSQTGYKKNYGLRTVMRAIYVKNTYQISPLLHVNWDKLNIQEPKIKNVHLSLTHEKEHACALVVIENVI